MVDALRGIAITAVLFDHYTDYMLGLRVGDLAVSYFICLSAYFVTRSIAGEKSRTTDEPFRIARRFYIRRISRVFPVYYTMLLFFLIVSLAGSEDFNLEWHLLFATNIAIAAMGTWEVPWQLCHLWTLSLQEQLYLVWPFVVLGVRRQDLARIAVALIVVGWAFRVALFAAGLYATPGSATWPPAMFDALGLGVLLALGYPRRGDRGLRAMLGCAMALPAGFAALSALRPDAAAAAYPLLWDCYRLFPVAALAYWAFTVKTCSPAVERLIGPVVLLGRISLGMYLFHLPLWWVASKVGDRTGWWSLEAGLPTFAILSTATTVLALLSWRYLERPVSHAIRSRSSRADANASP
ncbi:acyltransferase family protein [Prosthecomicrobium sp. N25]|uniref:acyltransferase family protein n=1 Tax=Prosthecomicrobium sp. N25 TaxID=3129254 RepID=UPI003077A73E